MQRSTAAAQQKWNTSYLYLLAIRQLARAKPHNERPTAMKDVKARMVELRNHGHTYPQIASILNEQKWVPLKGRKFTGSSVGKLLRATEPTNYLTPQAVSGNDAPKCGAGT